MYNYILYSVCHLSVFHCICTCTCLHFYANKLKYYLALCPPFVVCGVQLFKNLCQEETGVAFFGFRSTRCGKSSAC